MSFRFDPNSTENEGRFRLIDPKKFEPSSFHSWHSWNNISASGIRFIVGKINGEDECQAIRFNKLKWNEEKAGKWWQQNKDKFKKTWSWNKKIIVRKKKKKE